MSLPPKVFVSYSHDSTSHKEWVVNLATQLRRSGIDAILDQWDLTPGKDLVGFMEDGINSSERVLVICTDEYTERANTGRGGVGYEKILFGGELTRDLSTNKFVPLLRSKSKPPPIPRFLGTRLYVDFTDDTRFEQQFAYLLRELHKAPLLQKPEVGPNPFVGGAGGHGQTQSSVAIDAKAPDVSGDPAAVVFVLKSWLDSGGDREAIAPYVKQWFESYHSKHQAVFLLNSWLHSGGDEGFVAPYVSAWLKAHGNTQHASFLIVAWLKSGGSRHLVAPYMDQWLERFST
jgi:TIR domain